MPRWYIGMVLRHVDFLVSDVPGIPVPVYLGGAKVIRQYAFGPTIGAAVNVTLLHHCRRLRARHRRRHWSHSDFAEFYDCLADGFRRGVGTGNCGRLIRASFWRRARTK